MWFYSQSTFGIFLFVGLFFVYMPVIGEASKNLPTNCPYTPLSPPPTQTHAHRVPLKTAFHSLHIQTHNSSVTSHSRGTAATLHFILKLTKQQKTAEQSYFPFFDRFSLLPHGFLLLSLFLPVYLSLQTSASFLPLFHRQSGLPSPIPSFLSWHVKLLLRNSCAYTADLYQQKKIPHQPAEHLDEAGKCVLQGSDVYNVCTAPKQKEKALYLSHLP